MKEEFKIVSGSLVFEKSRYSRTYHIKPIEYGYPIEYILDMDCSDIDEYIHEHFGGWRSWDNVLRFGTKEKAQEAWEWCNSIMIAKKLAKR